MPIMPFMPKMPFVDFDTWKGKIVALMNPFFRNVMPCKCYEENVILSTSSCPEFSGSGSPIRVLSLMWNQS